MKMLAPAGPSALATGGFVAIVIAVAFAIAGIVRVASVAAGESPAVARRRSLNVLAVIAGWLAVSAAIAATGLLARFDSLPPPFVVVVAVTWMLSTAIAFSPVGTMVARRGPTAMLVGLQVFRFPLELVLLRLSLDGVLPVQMTFDGMNYDIATGIVAGILGLWASWREPPRAVVLLWNLMGLALLLTIVTIAVLSAPVPFRVFMNEPANTIVSTVPFAWLPLFLVQVAWIGHVLVFRRLFGRR